MTRDHFRKKAVRTHAAATGRSFLDAAAALHRDSGHHHAVLAARLRDELVAALDAAGWPVVVEHNPLFHALPIYAGPATIHVRRNAEPPLLATGDEHPDDREVFDLAAPLSVTVWAPLIVEYSAELGRVIGVDAHDIPATLPPAEIVAELDRLVGQARSRDLSETPLATPCGLCGDRYAADGLARPARSQVAVCPCCAFDGDLLAPEPGMLAFDLDRITSENLAIPAGWAGAQALLCCLGGPDLPAWLDTDWRNAGTSYPPREEWGGTGQTWVWLPAGEQRPAALAGLGGGASLTRVLAAIEQAHPDARDRFHAYLARDLHQGVDGDEDGHDEAPVPGQTIDRFWPAVVAYTVALLTQHAERPGHRPPWHVLASLELSDWIDILAPDLDPYAVETVLRSGILTLRGLLDPVDSEDQRDNEDPAAERAT
ncbi:hypothetical protein [Amycolatopsis magusensis]|uniref:hypothetical protein n=1 Tax=Amycolatopsis magusensis TaxID=882444 RepID=UPI00378781B9